MSFCSDSMDFTYVWLQILSAPLFARDAKRAQLEHWLFNIILDIATSGGETLTFHIRDLFSTFTNAISNGSIQCSFPDLDAEPLDDDGEIIAVEAEEAGENRLHVTPL